MTTIAFDGLSLAGDRAAFADNIRLFDTVKVWRRDDGALIGCCGATTVCARFTRWFMGGEEGASPVTDTEDFNAIIVRPNLTVEFHDRFGWSPVESFPVAIGSGREVALGAMDAGLSAREAVRIAAARGVGQETSIDVVTVLQRPSVDNLPRYTFNSNGAVCDDDRSRSDDHQS